MQDQAAPEGKQASKSRKCPSSGSANGRSAVNGDSSPPPSSPQIVVNSKDDVQAIAQQIASQPALPVARPDAWGVLTPISEKAKTRPQASHIFLYNNEHVLGRLVKDSSCQFDSINVSARHCTIFRKKFKADDSCIPLQGAEPVSGDRWLVYIKDSSSNGTFINWQKLKKDSPEARIKDGDIISLVNAPEHENAFAFLYQEIKPNSQTLLTHQFNGAATNSLKRKNAHDGENVGECISGDSKRVKGLGFGGPDGPVSLDDVRRLQRSNEELRSQLETHVLTIEKLRAESRAATARHDAEIKEIRETVSVAFLGQIQDLRLDLGKKEKEIDDYASLCAQQHSKLEDLNQSLVAANQSRKDADEVIQSQNLNIVELKEQLEDERSQRRSEREKAEVDLKAAVDRARLEASEELKRQSETAARQLREQLEMINKLQEADKENRSLVEVLRCKLEDMRENIVKAERTSRSLELRLHEEELSLAIARKKVVEKEEQLQHASKGLQEEKTARDEALAKLSSLEVEMESAIRDLSLEKQRLQGARERIVLRETQLRAFHSTAEEIAGLQQKQQEQLQAMMRALEDGVDENYMSGQNHGTGNAMAVVIGEGDTDIKGVQKEGADNRGVSNDDRTVSDGGKDAGSDSDSQTIARAGVAGVLLHRTAIEDWGDGDTQVEDSTGLLDAPKDGQVATKLDMRKGSEPSMLMGTEAGYTQLLETESNTVGKSVTGKYPIETQHLGSGRDDTALLQTTRVCAEGYYHGEEEKTDKGMDEEAGGLGGETMILEDEDDQEVRHWERRQPQAENLQKATKSNEKEHEDEPVWPRDKLGHVTHAGREDYGGQGSRAKEQPELMSRRDGPLTTLDLLTSEVAGSWAMSTPASVHCENEGSSESEDEGIEKVTNEAHVDFAASQVGNCGRNVTRMHLQHSRGENLITCAANQSSVSPRTSARHAKERRDLNTMLDIVAPDFSRLHGLDRVIQTAPDSADHTEEEEDKDDETDGGDSAESQSQ